MIYITKNSCQSNLKNVKREISVSIKQVAQGFKWLSSSYKVCFINIWAKISFYRRIPQNFETINIISLKIFEKREVVRNWGNIWEILEIRNVVIKYLKEESRHKSLNNRTSLKTFEKTELLINYKSLNNTMPWEILEEEEKLYKSLPRRAPGLPMFSTRAMQV